MLARFVDDRAELRIVEGASERIGVRRARAFVRENLDEVDAPFGERSHDAPQIVRPVQPASQREHLREVEQEIRKRVDEIRTNLITRGDDTRHVARAGGMQLAHADVDEMRRAEHAHGRRAQLECAARAREIEQMRMSVDQPGKEPAALEIKHLAAGRHGGPPPPRPRFCRRARAPSRRAAPRRRRRRSRWRGSARATTHERAG